MSNAIRNVNDYLLSTSIKSRIRAWESSVFGGVAIALFESLLRPFAWLWSWPKSILSSRFRFAERPIEVLAISECAGGFKTPLVEAIRRGVMRFAMPESFGWAATRDVIR